MNFIDFATIYVKAGNGGNGCTAFLRENLDQKVVPLVEMEEEVAILLSNLILIYQHLKMCLIKEDILLKMVVMVRVKICTVKMD